MTKIIFNNFKPYSYYLNKTKSKTKTSTQQTSNEPVAQTSPKNLNLKALIGSIGGILLGLSLGPQIVKAAKVKNNTLKEVIEMLSMAGLANIFSVGFASLGENKEQKKKKVAEAGFQIMNTSIPMIMVSSVIELTNKIKCLNNKPAKIASSLVAMVGGAMLATKITNATKKDNEPKRKYGIKDSIANFDDIVATIVIGFPQYQKLNTVAKSALPFIYTYCGYRAGDKK